LALVLVGPVSYELPPHPDIVVTGAVSEADKWDIMRDALVSVSPSALESFSLVVIEAWVEQLPVLVNGACGPTREHCERSGGGLWFTSYPEFEAVLRRLVSDTALRAELGRRGRVFVDRHFRWPVLVKRYDEFLTAVVQRGRGTPGLF
jgi:glycosyltransferase involved in cell wall biosynthesis